MKIGTLNAQGNTSSPLPAKSNVSTAPNSGVEMGSWNPHNAAAAAGQASGSPNVEAPKPSEGIPGKALDYPATAVPGNARAEWAQDAFGVAGRASGISRESQ